MKKLYAIALAFIVLLSMTMNAAALCKTICRENGEVAYAEWTTTECTDKGCIENTVYLSVMETTGGTDIFVEVYSYNCNTGIGSWKWGYLFTEEDVFDTEGHLNNAVLSPVCVDLYDYETSTIESVCISAEWCGENEVDMSSFCIKSKFDDYFIKLKSIDCYRDATATGSIGCYKLGMSEYAGLIKFKECSMEIYR